MDAIGLTATTSSEAGGTSNRGDWKTRKAFYCWMRVVRREVLENEKEVEIKAGSRPPNAFVDGKMALIAAALPSDHSQDAAQERVGDDTSTETIQKKPKSRLEADEYASFYALPGREGLPSSEFEIDYGPAFSEFDEARGWIYENEARDWATKAQTYALISLAHVVDFKLGEKSKIKPCECQSKKCFPPDAWTDDFFGLADQEPSKENKLFEKDAFDTFVSAPGDSSAECQNVIDALDARTEMQRKEILAEARGGRALAYFLFKKVGIDIDRQPNRIADEIIQIVLDATTQTIFRLKMKHCRGRPYHLCDDVKGRQADVMFANINHRWHPGHPSYPGGHAAFAHALSTLIATRFKLGGDLEREADRIASNRESAGLHFRSDSVAGKALGIAMAEAMLAVDESGVSEQIKENRQRLVGLLQHKDLKTQGDSTATS